MRKDRWHSAEINGYTIQHSCRLDFDRDFARNKKLFERK